MPKEHMSRIILNGKMVVLQHWHFYRHVSFLWLKQVILPILPAENPDTSGNLAERMVPVSRGELSTSLPWTSGKPQPFGVAIMWPPFSSPPVELADLDSELDMRTLQRDHVITQSFLLLGNMEVAHGQDADACIRPHVHCPQPLTPIPQLRLEHCPSASTSCNIPL